MTLPHECEPTRDLEYRDRGDLRVSLDIWAGMLMPYAKRAQSVSLSLMVC